MFQTPINPMASQFGIYSQPSQTAAAPAQSTFVVGDAAKKKRIAEALRGKVSQDYEQMAPTGHVEGFGAFPGQSYINWGSILSNAAQPLLEASREEDALAAEDEAAAARSAALEQLLGNDELSKADAIRAQDELGLDVSSLVPEKEKLANFLQAIPNLSPDAAAMLAPQFGLDPEEARQMVIARQQAEKEEQIFATDEAIRKENATRAPAAGRAPSEYENWKADNPDGTYEEFLAIKQKYSAKGGGSGGASGGKYDFNRATEKLGQTAIDLRALIEGDTEGQLFSKVQGAAQGAREVGQEIGGITGGLLKWGGTKAESPLNTKLRTLNLGQVLEDIGRLAPVTAVDVQLLKDAYPNAFSTKESAIAFVELMEQQLAQAQAWAANNPDYNPDAAARGPTRPSDVSPELWNIMTPEERLGVQ